MTPSPQNAEYTVVVNHEQLYSIWPAAIPVPEGWRATGDPGSIPQCLAHIDEMWTDLRPSPPSSRD